VKRPGQCLLDVEPPDFARRYRKLAASAGAGWFVPASPQFLKQWGITSRALRARVAPRLTDFPLRCLTDPVLFDRGALDLPRKVYVDHTQPPPASLQASFDHAAAAGRETHQLAYGHDLMLEAPKETATLLDAIAQQRS
jgi:hypothetical protein